MLKQNDLGLLCNDSSKFVRFASEMYLLCAQARNYRFPAIDGGTLFNQTQLSQKQQFDNNVMLKIQKSDIGTLTRFVQQLNQNVQQQNRTILQYEKRLRLLNYSTNQQSKLMKQHSCFTASLIIY